MPGVYLLCFERPYIAQTGKCQKYARHYVGAAKSIPDRTHQHENGTSRARLMQVVHEAEIKFEVVRTWEFKKKSEAFEFEQYLKRQRHHARLCPRCHSGTEFEQAPWDPLPGFLRSQRRGQRPVCS